MLTLYEKLFLLPIDDAKGTTAKGIYGPLYFGLPGAILADLTLQGRLAIEDRYIVVANPAPTGDFLLDEILTKLIKNKKPHKASHWVRAIGSNDLPTQIANGLRDKNILRAEEKHYFGVIPYAAYTQYDASAKFWVKEQLRAVVLANRKPELEDVALLSLLKACSLLNLVFTKDERKAVAERVALLASGDIYGEAVADVLDSIDAAVLSAVTAVAAN